MSAFLHIDELPRDRDGILVGQYHVRMRGSGAVVEEVGERAVGTVELSRLDAAFGSYITIAPADAETAETCARHLFERSGDGVRAKALRALFPRRAKPKAPASKKTEKTEEGAT